MRTKNIMRINLFKPSSFYKIVLVLLLLCIGLYCVPLSIMGNDFSQVPGLISDSSLNIYFLEHGYQWLSGNQKSFWNAPFFYPEPNVMAFSDNFLGVLPIYSVFRFAGFDRETSFQWWFISIFILNFVSCAWVLRKISISLLGAAAGAYIFTFSLPVIAQLIHFQLLPRFMVPVAFYFAWSYLNNPKLKSLAGLCLSIVLQLYCTIYLGFFLVLTITVFILFLVIINPKYHKWREILWSSPSRFTFRLAIITASGLILLPLFYPYYTASSELGLRSWSEISTMLPRIQSFLFPVKGSLLWDWLTPLGNNLPMKWEHAIFVGAMPWIAVAAVIFDVGNKNKNAVSDIGKAATCSILLIILTVLYWNGFSFYKLITLIPGSPALRGVTRIILVLLFLFAVSTGVFFTRLENYQRGKRTSVLMSAFLLMLLCVLVAEQYVLPNSQPRFGKGLIQYKSRTIAEEVLKRNPSAKVFAYMPPRNSWPIPHVLHTYAMLASQSINIPTVNGYSSNFPQNYRFFDDYDKLWILKGWIARSNAKYSKIHDSNYDLFNELVIVGSDKNFNDIPPVSIAYQALPNNAFKAEILPDVKNVTVKNSSTILPVKIINKSGLTWPALGDVNGKYQISLSYRWLALNGEEIEGYNTRFPLHYDLLPDEIITLDIEIEAPSIPGRYIAEFDLVQEHVSWFANKGSKTARIETDTREPAVTRDYIMLSSQEHLYLITANGIAYP